MIKRPKVCLIFPRTKYATGDVPLGITYIASVLRDDNQCELTLIDTTFDKDLNRAKNILKKKQFDIVGFSVMTSMLTDSLILSREIKKMSPHTKVIFGGPHPTIMPYETLANDSVDAICHGESEYTFRDIIRKHNSGFKDVRGITYKLKNKIIKNKAHAFIKNLDKLPFPALEYLDMKKYLKNWYQLDTISPGSKGINMMAMRGCPYSCSYCQPTLDNMFGKKIRMRSPKNIADELKYWKEKYKINAFTFADDTFVLNKEWVLELCKSIKPLKLIWSCDTRANLIDVDLFKKMKEAGLRKVCIGIESGSQRILDKIYNKQITIQQVKTGVRKLKSLKLKILGLFMIGAPTESKKEILKTIKLSKDLDIDEAAFSITTPLPGTYLYEKTEKMQNKEVQDFDYYRSCVFKNNGKLDSKKIERLKQRALLSFYLSPKHLPSTIKSFLTIDGMKKNLLKMKRF